MAENPSTFAPMAAKNGKKRHGNGLTLARQADRYALYQQAVQEPELQCHFFDRVFRTTFGRRPEVLREDFCGTGAVCCEWVKGGRSRLAYGYDLDPEPLAWGERHNVVALDSDARRRLRFVRQDVCRVSGPKADLISAENFSYFGFHTRQSLLAYLQAARRNLADEGLLVLDVMGGSGVQEEGVQGTRAEKGFRYVWDLARFDPINSHCTFYIHFRFRDGSELRRAFRYDWRLWTIPEVRELLLEAGFRRADVYWEGEGEDGEGDGIFRRREHAPYEPVWVAYVVGIK